METTSVSYGARIFVNGRAVMVYGHDPEDPVPAQEAYLRGQAASARIRAAADNIRALVALSAVSGFLDPVP